MEKEDKKKEPFRVIPFPKCKNRIRKPLKDKVEPTNTSEQEGFDWAKDKIREAFQ